MTPELFFFQRKNKDTINWHQTICTSFFTCYGCLSGCLHALFSSHDIYVPQTWLSVQTNWWCNLSNWLWFHQMFCSGQWFNSESTLNASIWPNLYTRICCDCWFDMRYYQDCCLNQQLIQFDSWSIISQIEHNFRWLKKY